MEKDTIPQNKFDSEIDIRQVELEHANLIVFDLHGEYNELSYAKQLKICDSEMDYIYLYGFLIMKKSILCS